LIRRRKTAVNTNYVCTYSVGCFATVSTKTAKDIPLHSMKALGGRGGIAPTHSHLGIRWDWSASRPGRTLALGKGPHGTHCTRTGGWVGPRAGLDTEDRGKILSPLPVIEPRSPGRPARSQTLY
jgi:hypothetical protein